MAEPAGQFKFYRYALANVALLLLAVLAAMILAASSSTSSRSEDTAGQKSGCHTPSAREDEEVVFLGTYSGSRKSDYSISDDDDTGVAGINIIDGVKPLYIIAAASKPVIWQVEGKTDRVSRLLLAGPTSRQSKSVMAGETGLEASKVSYIDASCLPEEPYSPERPGFKAAGARIQELVGYAPVAADAGTPGHWFEVKDDGVKHIAAPPLGAPGPNRFIRIDIKELPVEPPPGWDRVEWAKLLMRHPAGIAELDGKSIVSQVVALHKEIKPGKSFFGGGDKGFSSPPPLSLNAKDYPVLGASPSEIARQIVYIGGIIVDILFCGPVIAYFFVVVLGKAFFLSRKTKTAYWQSAFWLFLAEISSLIPVLSFTFVVFLLAMWLFGNIAPFGLAVVVGTGIILLAAFSFATSRMSNAIESRILAKGLQLESVAAGKKLTSNMNSRLFLVLLALAGIYALLIYKDHGKPVPTFHNIIGEMEAKERAKDTFKPVPVVQGAGGISLPANMPRVNVTFKDVTKDLDPLSPGEPEEPEEMVNFDFPGTAFPDAVLAAAKGGDKVAQYRTGMYYQLSLKNHDSEVALDWLEKSADQGYAPAQYGMGFFLSLTSDDSDVILEWYRKAAKQGYFMADFLLAKNYGDRADPGKRDYEEACFWAMLALDAATKKQVDDGDKDLRFDTSYFPPKTRKGTAEKLLAEYSAQLKADRLEDVRRRVSEWKRDNAQ